MIQWSVVGRMTVVPGQEISTESLQTPPPTGDK